MPKLCTPLPSRTRRSRKRRTDHARTRTLPPGPALAGEPDPGNAPSWAAQAIDAAFIIRHGQPSSHAAHRGVTKAGNHRWPLLASSSPACPERPTSYFAPTWCTSWPMRRA